jgi:hypothetical protein
MSFIENNLLIPLNEIKNISIIPNKDKIEHFTEDDYKKINEDIKKLRDFNTSLIQKIKENEDNLKNIENQSNAYNTFIHMFDNIQSRNESYYKTLMLLITLIFILILCIISYYIYYKRLTS